MKLSLLITVLILVLTAVFGWKNHHELREAEAAYLKAKSQPASTTPTSTTGTSRERQGRARKSTADPKALGKELIALIRSSKETTTTLDDEQRMLDLQSQLIALDSAQMKSLISEINAAGLSDEIRDDALYVLLESLAENHPLSVLGIIGETPDLISGHRRLSATSLALGRAMAKDRTATVEWFMTNRGHFTGSDGDSLLTTVFTQAAALDPDFAFSLIPRIGVSDLERTAGIITRNARTAEARERTLPALRGFLKSISDPAQRDASEFEGLSSILYSARNEGLDRGLPWIEKNLSAAEIEKIASRSFPTLTSGETAQWLTFLNRVTPTEKIIKRTIGQTFSDWAQHDCQAAERWLAELPEGPAKNTAAIHYAYVAAKDQPDTAARWLQILPPEKQSEVLKDVIAQWPPSDPDGAAAFTEKVKAN